MHTCTQALDALAGRLQTEVEVRVARARFCPVASILKRRRARETDVAALYLLVGGTPRKQCLR